MKKRLFRLSMVLATVLLLFASCAKEKEYDENLIYGKWSATDGYFYNFEKDHTGSSTNINGKGLEYDWSLDSDELQLRFKGSGQYGKAGYQTFVIKSLSSTKMEAYDKLESEKDIITFTKQ